MPLRLRRGTDTERLTITPAEAELIYVTDTTELWIGDGTTAGGIKVTGNIPNNLSDLDDVDLSSSPQIGQVLKWNGIAFVPADDIDTNTAGIVEGSNYRINIVSDDSTVMVDTTNQSFIGNLEGNVIGDVNGSIFSDNSTLLVDSINRTLDGVFIGEINSSASAVIANTSLEGHTLQLYNFVSNTNSSKVTLRGFSGTYEVPEVPAEFNRQGISFDYFTGSEYQTTSLINSYYRTSGAGYLALTVVDIENNFFVNSIEIDGEERKTIITGKLELNNDVVLGRISRSERDQLIPLDGTMLYNTTLNKFQGYQNGVWINLDDGSVDIT